jgi:hypothetical protein
VRLGASVLVDGFGPGAHRLARYCPKVLQFCATKWGGSLTLDPPRSLWVPHPFTVLVKGAGVEFDF